ncbi:hypothetical protein EWE75_22585 [Sphingomonas populi]|uniref:Uncharacterized protein n=1 Tax=Sphingomonas populi TaxID=2484750 RepID=A0A4Q6XSM9_9SPHN|nr:hypothetical protein [Sphingomonas populi]RZF60542.1 hypothetical protein EWE75_22585 [Sphingomonas populi]
MEDGLCERRNANDHAPDHERPKANSPFISVEDFAAPQANSASQPNADSKTEHRDCHYPVEGAAGLHVARIADFCHSRN